MKEELKSMDHIGVWDLVELPKGCKRVGCKWVFKTKHDSNAISNYIRLDSLLRVLLGMTVLTTMRRFLMFQKRTLLELSWQW